MARTAVCLLRPEPPFRRDAFMDGLIRCGFRVTDDANHRARQSDVLVIWNRYGLKARLADQWEAAGATVLVAENGWIGRDQDGRQLYALCRSHHNGAGAWHVGETDRWSKLNIEVKPWRERGDHILVLPQRGFGHRFVAMPLWWPEQIVRRLKAVTKRPIRVRNHPGKSQSEPYDDFRNCWAAVTWASGAGIKAIVAGIPVFYDFQKWIGADAAERNVERIEEPFLGDRLPMLRRLAWAQWSLAEISAGEPFACLCR